MTSEAGSGSNGSASAPSVDDGGHGGSAVPAGGSSSTGGEAGEAMITPPPPIDQRQFDAGVDPGRNNVQAGAVCARLAQIQCAGEAFCCEDPGRTVPTCEAAMRDSCIKDLMLDSITKNTITGFDPTAAASAFTQFEMLASTCDLTIGSYGASTTGLMSMLRGTVAPGSSCSPKGIDNAAAAAALVSCTGVETTACMPKSALSWSCEARGPVGADCFSDLNCQEGLTCPNPALTSGQYGLAKCAARKADGASCTLPTDCVSLSCQNGVCAQETRESAYCLMTTN